MQSKRSKEVIVMTDTQVLEGEVLYPEPYTSIGMARDDGYREGLEEGYKKGLEAGYLKAFWELSRRRERR